MVKIALCAMTAMLAFQLSAHAQPTPPAAAAPATVGAGSAPPVAAEAAAPPAAPGAAPASAPKEKDAEATNFTIENSLTLRDPFRRLILDNNGTRGSEGLPELERFDVEKFKLVGVITGPKKSKALVTGPSGKLHIVSEDTKIGTREGVIRKIAPGMIEIQERVVNLLGQEEQIETVLQFKEEGKKDKL